MTYLRILLCSTFLFSASCSVIEREAGYPGGNLGFASDRKILFAQGHEQRVQRYLVTLALLAPLVSETAATPIEAKLSAERINAIYDKLGVLKMAANQCRLTSVAKTSSNTIGLDLNNCNVGANGLPANALAFESISFDVAKSLNNALKQADDNLNLRKRVSNVTALAPSEILKTVLRARHLLPVAMKYFATYRDVTAVLSASVLESCNTGRLAYGATGGDTWPLEAACKDTEAKVSAYLTRGRIVSDDLARKDKPIREIYKSSQNAINAGLNWKFSKKHAAALMFHIDRTCLKLVKLQEIEETSNATDCRLSKSKSAKAFFGAYK